MADKIIEMADAVKARLEEEKEMFGDKKEDKVKLNKFIIKCLNSNEDGDAALFKDLHESRFVYDHGAACWHEWKEHYWTEDVQENAMKGLENVIDTYGVGSDHAAWIATRATKAGDKKAASKAEETRRDLLKRIRQLQAAGRKKNVLYLATIGTGLRGDEWDCDPWLLGCRNGVIELKTGSFRPGRQEDYIKTFAPTEWKGLDAKAPTWQRFLSEIFEEDQELIAYLQRLFGYGIIGVVREHVYPILWGDGRNGKGTIVEALRFVLGDLSLKAKAETMLDSGRIKGSGSADADTLAFRGKRLVWASETNSGHKLNTGKIKELAGGDSLNARAPYGRRPVVFQPTHLLLLLTNNRPKAPASDFALWSRIALIPFRVSFVEEPAGRNECQADFGLLEKLKTEAPGILAWLVRGCLEYQNKGLKPPDVVKMATADYRKENDLISQFIDEKCVLHDLAQVKAGDLYKAYQSWTLDMGLKAISGVRFGKNMKKLFDHVRPKEIYYLGIGLLSENNTE